MAVRLDFLNCIVTISQSNLEEPSSNSNTVHYGRLSQCSTVMTAVQMRVLKQFCTFSGDVSGLIVGVSSTKVLTGG